MNQMIESKYVGRILTGNYSQDIKNWIKECIDSFILFERTGNPAIFYLAAWEDEQKTMWYEYASKGFLDLFACDIRGLAEVFRASIIDRRIIQLRGHFFGYKYQDIDGITKEIIPQKELEGIREELRESSKKMGIIEAVYKIQPAHSQPVWLKDQEIVETRKQDNICVSSGCLTVVSKEMEAEEEREKLVVELQNAMAKVKILNGMLPICAWCKNIRDDKGYWSQIETYIRDHSEADFSHSICPDCAKKHHPEPDH